MSTAPEQRTVRRAFTLFVTLVVVPVLGLVSFGVVAIANERAAVEKRITDEYSLRLREVGAELRSRMDEAVRQLDSPAATPVPLSRFRFRILDGEVTTTPPVDTAAADALVAAVRSMDLAEGEPATVFQLARGAARGLYAVRRRVEGLETFDEGLAFSTAALSRLVEESAARKYPTETALLSLQPPADPVPAPAPGAGAAVSRLLDEATSAPKPLSFASIPLPDPLGDWHLVASPGLDDPVQDALIRNRTVYVVLLSVFYAAITIGIVLTMRSIWREAAASRLKTDFVSNISHELRTPLTSIRMFAETLQQGRARTEQERAECVDFIAKEAERLSILTERALDWARLEAGRRRFVLERTPTAAFVDETLAMFEKMRPLTPGTLVVTHAPGLPDLDVDRSALTQVLLNLLENAVKYTGPEKRIEVGTRVTRRGVAITVRDNGIGIEKRDQKRVFERFYRADDLLARSTEGTGLGLSIAQRITQAHGGRITLESAPGKGSTFTVALPATSTPTPPKSEGRS